MSRSDVQSAPALPGGVRFHAREAALSEVIDAAEMAPAGARRLSEPVFGSLLSRTPTRPCAGLLSE